MILIVIVIAIGSAVGGYLLGSNRHPGSAALVHHLQSELRSELLSRQNWTSREILARISSAVHDLTISTEHELEVRHNKHGKPSQGRSIVSRNQ
jgi:hypothetical protein